MRRAHEDERGEKAEHGNRQRQRHVMLFKTDADTCADDSGERHLHKAQK